MRGAEHSKYENYRDTGVKWLGFVPDTWTVTRLGTVFTERRTKVSDKDYEPLSVTKTGILPQLESAAKTNDGDNRKLVKKGDFVINSRSDRKGSSGVSPLDGSVSLINIVLQPKGIHPEFCNYILKSYAFVEEYYRMGHGIVADLWTTRYDEMRGILMALPSPKEQCAIAGFLNDKCAKIEEAVKIKEDQIALLHERRKIIIQNAVMRGLNSDIALKDSGIDWIGQIPTHWKITRLGVCLQAAAGRNRSDLPLLSITRELGVIERNVEDQESNHNFIPEDLSNYRLLRAGQFGMNKMKAWQGSYGISPLTGIVSPAYFVFDLKIDVDPAFFNLALRTGLYVSFFYQASDGVRIGQWDLSRERMKQIPFVIPSQQEQLAIVHFASEQTQKINAAIDIKVKQISALKEYKSSLINAAVTGKIKVV